MKNKMVEMTKKRNARAKADAAEAKQEISKNKSHVKQENQKHMITTNPAIAKEPKTIMID